MRISMTSQDDLEPDYIIHAAPIDDEGEEADDLDEDELGDDDEDDEDLA